MNLPSNLFDGNVNVQTFLCQPDKTIIGELNPYDFDSTFKFNTYSEISFSVDRYYNDMIDGKTKVNPYYDLIDSIRVIYLRGIGHFVIQDIDENIAENESKSLTCFSLEYSTGQKYLESFYVNTGEEGSVETIYHAQKYGAEYSIDNYYTQVTATDKFDAYGRYYIKEYTSNTAYNYVEVQITDADDFINYDEQLYVKKYPNVRFYWPSCPELSLLHLVFSRIPEWKIGHVDKGLWYQERTFTEERTAIYDFLYNTAAETLKFVMVWDSINGVVNFYKTEEDGMTTDNEVETQWDTDVFISRENLASAIDIKYSTDDIKTKLKITGSDNLDVRDVNLGQNYILNLSYYNTPLWLGYDLHEKYNQYTEELEEYAAHYKELISAWSAAYNEYSDLMNYVPINPRVMLIGDVLDKLYCVYNKYVPATTYNNEVIYYSDMNGTKAEPQPTTTEEVQDGEYYIVDVSSQVSKLNKKLKLYKVDQQDNGKPSTMAKTDDVLLTLENSASDSATIRVRYDQDDTSGNPQYCVYRTLTTASTGVSNTTEYTITQWVSGELTADKLNLSGFTVKSIGTLGAYLCIAKDETVEANVEEYGIRLLKEKQDIYTKIFITQTEGYMNKEGSQCVASDEKPEGEISSGTKWLDTDSDPLEMHIYNGSEWVVYDPEDNKADYENYARFYENYQKLEVVQKVLAKKQLQADYLLNGVAVSDRYLTDDNINSANLLDAASHYFLDETITLTEYNKEFGFISFIIDSDKENEYAIYVSGGTPYVSYSHSQGLCLTKMNVIKNASDMNTFFTEEELVRLSPFIREDEYSDDNFLLTGYESEDEQMHIKQELLDEGTDELKKLCQPKLSFDATMANILAIPEFKPLKEQFQLGNFIRVGIRNGYVKRARLLEVQIRFDDKSDFSATFGDLISTKSEIDKHADLLKQAVTVSKSVASNQSGWQKGADKATELDKAINDGLKDAALAVASSSGQNITWDQRGILGRKLVDGADDVYEDEQFMLTNNKLIFTNDAWQTSKGVFGKFIVNGETHWGLLSDAVISGYIQGSEIYGGRLEIGGTGGKFIVNEDGSVQILASDNTEKYATTSALDITNQARQYHIELSYSGSTIFSTSDSSTTITARVFKWDEDITDDILGHSDTKFSWIRNSSSDNTSWNEAHANQTTNTITITNADVANNAQFSCTVQFDETRV